MKNKKMFIIAMVCVCVVGVLAVVVASLNKKGNESEDKATEVGVSDEVQDNSASEYPQIVYIDNVSYYNTDKICEMVPRQMPDGVIETFVDPAIMPDMFSSANFGSEYGSLEYIFLESGELIVHVGENWYYFEMPQ